MKCPICHQTHHIEIDLHSDGYAENLQECGDCGTIWTRHMDTETLVLKTTSTLTNVAVGSLPTPS